MTNLTFLLFRAFFITIMTIGMMASLTDFRFGRKKLLGILAVYSVWAVASSAVLLRLGGELLLLRLFFCTISIPAILLTYWTANDTPTQAVFNYITQILLSLLMASMVRLLTDTLCFPDFINILLMGVFLCYNHLLGMAFCAPSLSHVGQDDSVALGHPHLHPLCVRRLPDFPRILA